MKYNLEIKELVKLCRDFQADCYDGFVSNDNLYVEYWLKKNIKNEPCECDCDCLGELKHKDIPQPPKDTKVHISGEKRK